MQVAADRRRARRAPAAGPSYGASRSSGGRYGTPSARVDAAARRAATGSSPSAATYAALPVARTSAVPSSLRRRDDELDRHAVDRHAERPARARARAIDDDLGQPARSASITASGVVARARRRRGWWERSQPAARVAGGDRRRARSAIAPTSSQRAVQRAGRGAARVAAARARPGSSPRSPGRSPAPPQAACAAAASRSSSACRDAERLCRARHDAAAARARRGAPSPTSSGLHGRPRARRARRAGPSRRARAAAPRSTPPMPAQLPDAPAAHELRDGGGRRADQLGRAAIRADAVVARAREVEQGGERLEPLGERRVVGLVPPG